jgi:hypothetical protein
MKRIKSLKIVGSLLQALAILLILFNTPPAYSNSKNNSTKDAVLVCVAPSLVVASREANTSVPFFFSPIQINSLLEKNWRLTTLLHTSEQLTRSALSVPSAIYNIYYRVLRIHAP